MVSSFENPKSNSSATNWFIKTSGWMLGSEHFNYLTSFPTKPQIADSRHYIGKTGTSFKVHIPQTDTFCYQFCLFTIIRLVKFFIYSCWQVKAGSNAPNNTTFGYPMQKLWRLKVFLKYIFEAVVAKTKAPKLQTAAHPKLKRIKCWPLKQFLLLTMEIYR